MLLKYLEDQYPLEMMSTKFFLYRFLSNLTLKNYCFAQIKRCHLDNHFFIFQDGQNNNGYVPYVDYARDYNPPPSLQPALQSTVDASRESMQSTRLQLNSLQSNQIPVSGTAMPLNDLNDLHMSPSQNLPNGNIGGIDPRFSATYGNPYLRNSNVGLPAPHTAIPAATPAPPPYSRDISRNIVNSCANIVPTSVATVLTNGTNGANGAVPQVARLPNSPTSQYIVPNANLATIKRGTLATHV